MPQFFKAVRVFAYAFVLMLSACNSSHELKHALTYDEAAAKIQQAMPASGYFSNEFLQRAQSNPLPPGTATERLRIAMPWILNDECALWYVAVDQHYFDEVKIAPELIPGGPGKDSLALLIAGSVDIGVTPAGTAIQQLIASPTGAKVIAICTNLKDSPYGWITLDRSVPRNQGSNKQLRPEDVIGKTVGLQADGEVYGKYLLQKFSLPANQVKIVRVGFSTDPLVSGVVDFYAGWIQNQPRFLEQQGIRNWTILRFRYIDWNEHNDVSVATKALVQKNPGLVTRYVGAMIRAAAFYLDHPEETADITVRFSKDVSLTKEMVLRRFQLERDLVVGHDGQPPLWMSDATWNHAAALLTQYGVIDPATH